MSYSPLAEQMRPSKLEDVLGQDHIIGDGKIITELINSNKPFSLIFWGPPGSGKTTISRIIADKMEANFVELSAVVASKKDIMNVIEDAKVHARLATRTILFVDEIHRFNKSQQDAFLPYVENGLITLIGATTENPSFEVITPLLSRSRVIVLEPISKSDMKKLIRRAAQSLKLTAKQLPTASVDMLTELSGGDGRVALGNLEVASQLANGQVITKELVQTAAQKRVPGYDKNGENHYNLISAFIKSMRGSNIDATLYYLARILQAGEDPKFVARRMVIFASEDIGLVAPAALNIAVSAFQAVTQIGMPEAQYNLFHCASVLAKAPKSRATTDAMYKALSVAQDYPDLPVPLHLRNAPTKLMKDLGYGQNYKWQAEFKPEKGFMPPELSDTIIFTDS
ncbi:replication-associated recombination protein A [Candidatus Saccharibacteria bacterium]|nr:replication-associated recombination protein A [Candidatus Saccharibacteria bacterium]